MIADSINSETINFQVMISESKIVNVLYNVLFKYENLQNIVK